MGHARIIVGLGNPGADYEYTRHNIGFLTLRHLAQKLNFSFSLSSLTNGLVAEGAYEGDPCYLLMPLTYMNHSGVAIKQIIEKKNIDIKDVLVVTDDLNLVFGQLRFRAKGSDGGHNGLGSIIHQLETKEFARLRMGIGAPDRRVDTTDFVLGKFSESEKKKLGHIIETAAEGCLVWMDNGINKAMEKFNKRVKNGK